jgi:hypothetical protein
MMRVALVAMPWLAERSPSLALASLAAVLRRDTTHVVACRHEYLDVCQRLGPLYRPISLADDIGDLLYEALLAPRCAPAVRGRYESWSDHERRHYLDWRDGGSRWPAGPSDAQLDRVWSIIDQHLDAFVTQVAGRYDVVGFTTTFCQLHASLAAAVRLKAAHPTCRIVLGGTGVTGDAARLRRDYPAIDDVIEGEGESQLVELLETLDRHPHARPRASRPASPVPDFSDYFAEIERFDYPVWSLLPIAVERRPGGGEDGRPVARSAESIAAEVQAQVERHRRLRIMLIGDVLACGVDQLADAIGALNMRPNFACQLPAAVHPHDVLRLWEAGCDKVEFNYDTLSSRALRRSGSALRPIEILQAMRTCYELGLKNFSRLSSGSPDATPEEVAETVDILQRYAINYQPLDVRRVGAGPVPDAWHALDDAVAAWTRLHRELLVLDGITWFVGTRPLYYFDGGGFVLVVDRRHHHRDITLDSLAGELYLRCMEICDLSMLQHEFADRCTADEVESIVAELAAEELMFVEEGQVLSLAVAYRVELAVDRIRRARAGAPANRRSSRQAVHGY